MIKLSFLILSFLFLVDLPVQERINLDIEITGIKKMQGDIRIAIYSQENEFPSREDIMDFRVIPVAGKTVKCSFVVDKKGSYAIALLHDLNRSGDMDFNFVGWPKEPYAFSNNPGIWYREPTFDECAIEVLSDRKVEIKMK